MSNVHPAGGTPDRLGHLGLLRFSGPDAAGFLQGQVSNDTRPLSEGETVLAAYSSSQGRVLAILHLLPHSSGVLAVLARDLAAATAERLRKFVLRAKVKIEDLSDDYALAGAPGEESLRGAGLLPPGGGSRYAEQDGIGVAKWGSRVGSGTERFWIVGPAAPLEACLSAGRLDHELAWRLADIREGLPQVYAATSESFVAQMLNLDLLDGISFSKGCYTGQEIIARTQHLGRIKRRMFRLELPPGAWCIGQTVLLADGRTGRLTEVAPSGGGFEALAVLSLETASAANGAETVAAVELPLPYSHEPVKDR